MALFEYILQIPDLVGFVGISVGVLSFLLALIAIRRKSLLSIETIEVDMNTYVEEIQKLFSTLCNIIRMDYNHQEERNDVNDQLVTFFDSNSSLINKTIKETDTILTRYRSTKIIKRKIYANLESSLNELKWVRDYFKPTKFDNVYNIDNSSMLWTTNIQQFHVKNSSLQ